MLGTSEVQQILKLSYYIIFLFDSVKSNQCPKNKVEFGGQTFSSLDRDLSGATQGLLKKSRIRETKHVSTDADSSTDTTVGWTKNTQKPKFFEKRKKIIQNAKTQKRLEICQY